MNNNVTIIIAIIAGAFSVLGLVISKEQKVSEFRQQWIDTLRSDISEMLAQTSLVHAELLKLAEENPRDPRAFLDRTRDNYVDANRSITSARLRLNKSEKDSSQLLEAIDELTSLLGRSPLDTLDVEAEIYPINQKIEAFASIVLKGEWKRVKRGEPQFRIAKIFAFWVLTGAVIFAFVTLFFIR